jgi:hypothetical protein
MLVASPMAEEQDLMPESRQGFADLDQAGHFRKIVEVRKTDDYQRATSLTPNLRPIILI